MYERFYGLRERPFSLTPDPSYLYPSRVHKEALSHLRYGIEGHAGFIVITGEIGCGKTTMLQTVLAAKKRGVDVRVMLNPARRDGARKVKGFWTSRVFLYGTRQNELGVTGGNA